MEPSPRPQQSSMGSGIVVLALLFCSPIGLFLMWTRTNWSKSSKFAITGVLALLFVGSMMYSNSPAGKAELAAQQQAEQQAAEEDSKRRTAEQEAEAVKAKAAAKENAARAAAEANRAKNEFEADGLVLLMPSLTTTRENGFPQIIGVVENRRSQKLSYAQVTFNLYDNSGAQIGSALANINGLEAGGKWKFKAAVLEDGFDSYKVSELSGF